MDVIELEELQADLDRMELEHRIEVVKPRKTLGVNRKNHRAVEMMREEGKFTTTVPLEIREMVYALLLDVSPQWLYPLWSPYEDGIYDKAIEDWKDPSKALEGRSLLLVSKQVSTEALNVLYGWNRFKVEAWSGMWMVPLGFERIGRANIMRMKVLSVDMCKHLDKNGGFGGYEEQVLHESIASIFDEDSTLAWDDIPDASPNVLKHEADAKKYVLRVLDLLMGVGEVGMRKLELQLPGWEQGGRLDSYAWDKSDRVGYLKEACFKEGLLNDFEIVRGLKGIGSVESLRLGRTWDVVKARAIGKEMGVKSLTIVEYEGIRQDKEQDIDLNA